MKKHSVITVIVTIAVSLLILSCTTEAEPPLQPDPPVIHSLEAEADRVWLSDSILIVCTASSSDGAELSYEWWASGGDIDGDGTTATWAAPDFEGVYNIRVTVRDGHGGEAEEYVSVVVEANQPPVINSLTVDADWVFPGGTVLVLCDAEDPDGDSLTYEWSATAGHIVGTGSEITWTAPGQTGVQSVTVVVDDGHGGSATRTVHVSVMSDQPPVIDKLEITKDRHGHCYLREASWGYYVGQGQKYDIECIVSDIGLDLSYEWSVEVGEISETSGDGSMITWIAPNTAIQFTVTVTVTNDITGSSASESLELRVVACSPCTFRDC